MTETVFNFGVGFLSAALLAALLVPLLVKRASRRAVGRAIAATPYAPEEIRSDKDELRAKLAVSTRQLEMSVAVMKAKTLSKIAELGQKGDFIDQLKNEIGEKDAAIAALADRNKNLHEKLLAAEKEFELRSRALREAEEVIAGKEAELAELVAELGEHSAIVDNQRAEIDAMRVQIEEIRTSVTDYENALNEMTWGLKRDEAACRASLPPLVGTNDGFASRGAHRTRRR